MSTPDYARSLGFTVPEDYDLIRDGNEAISNNAVRTAALFKALAGSEPGDATDAAVTSLIGGASTTRAALDALYKLTSADGAALDVAVAALLAAATDTRDALDARYLRPTFAAGTVPVPIVPATNGYQTVSVDFAKPFAAAPAAVVVTPGSGRLTPSINSISATGFVVGFNNWTGAQASVSTARYIAISGG